MPKVLRRIFPISLVLALPAWLAPAEAAEVANAASSAPDHFDVSDKPLRGWFADGQVAATFALSDHSAVVGQQDGLTMNLGYKFDLSMGFEGKRHEWRNPLVLTQGVSRTPSIPQFIKSQDELRFESIYLYRVTSWFGPYVRAAFTTPALRGYDVRDKQTTYLIKRLDGSTETQVASSLPLTEMFRPLVMRQSLGPYARIVREVPFNLEARVGYGGREALAGGQFAVADDEATPTVEVKELEDQQQSGPDAAVSVWGKLVKDRVQYQASVEVMVPVIRNPDSQPEKSLGDLTNIDVLGSVSTKLTDVISMDYQLKLSRYPQLLDKTQVSHLFTLNFGVSTKKPAKPAAK